MADSQAGELDIESAVESIGADLGLGGMDDAEGHETVADEAAESGLSTEAEGKATTGPVIRPVPKSWAKEQHERWAKIDPETQAYIELREKQMLDGTEQWREDARFAKALKPVFEQYKPFLQQQGVDEVKAVQYLLNAHHRLMTAPTEQRRQLFQQLAKSYGLEAAEQAAQQQVDPAVKALQDRIDQLENGLTAREQAALNDARTKASQEVEAFAADPKHAYFEEVADDMAILIKSGMGIDDAYERAVWSNPVTRAKEIARVQTEHEAKLKENSRLDALKARKATSANVRSRDTSRTPTEPLGTMEDTMRETLQEIKQRAH